MGDDGGSSVGGVGSCGCTSWRLVILLLFCGREEVFCFPMGFLSWAMVMAPVWIGWWEKSSEEDSLDALSPLSVALSSGDFELLAVLVASSPKFLGVEMAGGHQFLLVRSVDLRHVDDLACYSVRQSKTLFLRRVGLWLQAAALTASSSNLWGGGGSSRGGSLRR